MDYTRSEGAAGKEYLSFRLGAESYGIDILKVQEIRNFGSVTKIVNAPAFILGVIDLRGIIVPIVDLRIKFGLPDVAYDEFTVAIVLNVAGRVVGIVVDAVSDVLSFDDEQVKAAPAFSSALGTQYVTGLASSDGALTILIDIEHLMTGADMALFDTVADTATAA